MQTTFFKIFVMATTCLYVDIDECSRPTRTAVTSMRCVVILWDPMHEYVKQDSQEMETPALVGRAWAKRHSLGNLPIPKNLVIT